MYADTEPYTEAELTAREKEYKEKYDKAAQGNDSNNESGTGDPYAKANYQYALTTDYLYGKYSKLHYSVRQGDGTYKTYDLEPTDEMGKTERAWKMYRLRKEQTMITSFLTPRSRRRNYGASDDNAKTKNCMFRKRRSKSRM